MSSLKPTNVIRTLAHAKQQHRLMRFFQADMQGAHVQGNSEKDKTNPKDLQHCSVIQQGDSFVVTALSLI
ncbi:hypothetical protein C9J01_00175 [Photobacterium rosenbergii]|uniref:Uncharacterized protein n=1 Tax=Photobacterium rosenbergii TaxID=294936 RepID=A0A2T3NIX7_9GAMM|nr:hypothetical protein [Photobacterium rosenbergii]PSW15474.1 hypothetical protein C9J01_00175 [Photobacterium rosenbergii]